MIDWTKPIRTAKGAEARLLGELHNVAYPMIVAVTYSNSLDETYEVIQRYRRDGRFAEATDRARHPMHLENVPVVTKRYLVLCDGAGYSDLDGAARSRDLYWPNSPLAEITLEDGKPVSVGILDE